MEDGQIQIRQATKSMEDGKELSKTYHRWVLSPGQDLTGQEAKVKTVAESVWTKEAIAAFKAKQAK